MNTFFISDLHLDEYQTGITAILLDFLQHQAIRADALYILGDFFEVWIGDDDITPFKQTIILALQALTKLGIPLYFMPGNRDFLIGKKFLQETGCQLLRDPTVIDLYGEPTLLLHGDILCTQDLAYLKFRRIVRNPLYQKIFLSLPLNLRKIIANKIRQKSQHDSPTKLIDIFDASYTEIIRLTNQYNVRLLIHGHTHRPAIHWLSLRHTLGCRITLSDWDNNHGNVLVCSRNSKRRLLKLKSLENSKFIKKI